MKMPKEENLKQNCSKRLGPYEIHITRKLQNDPGSLNINGQHEVVVDNTGINTGMKITVEEEFRSLILGDEISFQVTEEIETYVLQEQLETERAKCEYLEGCLACECPVCLEKLPISEAITLGDCGHHHCKPCLRQLMVNTQLDLFRTYQEHLPFDEWMIPCSCCRVENSSYIISENNYSRAKQIRDDTECEFLESAKEEYRAKGIAEGLFPENGRGPGDLLPITFSQLEPNMFQAIQYLHAGFQHNQLQGQSQQVMIILPDEFPTYGTFLLDLHSFPLPVVSQVSNSLVPVAPLPEQPEAEDNTFQGASTAVNDGSQFDENVTECQIS